MSSNNEELGFELPTPAKSSRTRVFAIVAIVVAGAFVFGYTQHHKARGAAPAASESSGAVRVDVIKAKAIDSNQALELPGVVKPLEETKIFPRTSGYVHAWNVDIGDKVKEGQLLAVIDTPELDAQIAQARAQLAQAQASVKQAVAQRDFSKSSSARYETLASQSLVSKAQVEQQQADAQTGEANLVAAQSNVTAQEANLRRLLDTKSFANVTAPFAGTITQRSIDRGTLVGEAGAATPMYTLDATDPVRIYIDVPQSVAPSIKVGAEAKLAVREYGGREFVGKITRASGALDPELHIMQTEIQVPNPDGALIPGMYVSAALSLPVPHRVVEIPATALYNDAQGLRVAVADAQNRIHYVPITIERDTGAALWIATGLTGDERILKIAVPSLAEGDLVDVSVAKPPAAAGSAQKSSP